MGIKQLLQRAVVVSVFSVVIGLLLAACGGGGGSSTGGGTATGGGGGGGTTSLWAISITPVSPPTLPVGMSVQFMATGTYFNSGNGTISYADISSQVAWASSSAPIATINSTGLATAQSAGFNAAIITASLNGVTSNQVWLWTTAAQLTSFTLSPTTLTLAAGQSQQITASGVYSDGTTQNINTMLTWSTSASNVASVGSGNVFAWSASSVPVVITATSSFPTLSHSAVVNVPGYSVGGTVIDLPASSTVSIQNGLDTLTLSNGAYIFPTPVANGGSYNVTVTTQPGGAAHPCTVVDGAGNILSNFVSFAKIVCAPAISTIAGTVNVIFDPLVYPATITRLWPPYGINGPTGGYVNGTGWNAQFGVPQGAAYDSSGNMYIADSGNNVIRKMTPAGVVTTFAGSGAASFVNSTNPLTAAFNWPQGVAVDGANAVYVADAGNHAIRKITQAGVVTTVAGNGSIGSTNSTNPALATFNWPHGVAVDAASSVYVADTVNNEIRKIASNGTVTTFAGNTLSTSLTNGTGTAASFNMPIDITVDATGTQLYVTDQRNNAVRGIVISSALVYTVSGTAGSLYPNDGTTASATFYWPSGITVDKSNNIYVVDGTGGMIRKITGTYSGGVYTGTVTSLAGANGSNWYVDGAASGVSGVAQIMPNDVVVDSSGNIFFTDSFNLIRKYTP